MKELLEKLYRRRHEDLSLMLLEEDTQESPPVYTIRPQKLIYMLSGTMVALILLIFAVLYITPLGNLMFDKDEEQMRATIMELNQRVANLQDSLNVRDEQLQQLQMIITEGRDTTFSVEEMGSYSTGAAPSTGSGGSSDRFRMISSRESVSPIAMQFDGERIIHSGTFDSAPSFPVRPPVEGTLTRSFLPDHGHYGIDIAANEGDPVRVIADGMVISSEWTMNSGYVIHVHHGQGYLSTYKHCSNVYRNVGDLVKRGDILGAVGEAGIQTSGPHLHLELWKDGLALDMEAYMSSL